MNKEEFLGLSLNPNQITKEAVIALESVLDEFPYFQTAQVIHLKGLKKLRSFKYNGTLKKVASYTTNRTVLFDFITQDVLDFEETSKLENDSINQIDVIEPKIIEHLNASIVSQSDFDNVEIEELIPLKRDEDILKKPINLQIGEPLNFSKNEEFSFNEWLNLTSKKEIERKKNDIIGKKISKKDDKVKKSTLSKQVDLIDNFIAKNPKIKPSKNQKIKDVALDSVKENTHLMTETLAQVYLEQKKYDKAITAFKILSLKYPKKSSFFAEKIEAIKYIQKNKS